MAISTSNTREQFPLSPKKVIKKTLANAIVWIFLLLIIYVFATLIALSSESFVGYYLNLITLGVFGFLFLVVLLSYLYQQWYYNVYFYDLTPDYIVIKKGPITPKEITIPYERVQDVYVDQDLLDRLFGLYDVHLSSATASSGMEAHIDGVEKTSADGLKTLLLQTVSQRISKGNGQSVLQNTQSQTL